PRARARLEAALLARQPRVRNSSRFGQKSVADAGFGHEIFRMCRVGLEFVTQLAHKDAQIFAILDMFRSPHLFKQLPLRENLPTVAKQDEKELVFVRSQVNICTPYGH